MAIKKSELYSALWKSSDELRGGMDASEYKNYVLTLLFVKYVTDKFKNNPYGEIIIPDGGSFDDIVAAKNSPNIGERINIIITKLAEANQLSGIINRAEFDDDLKLGKGRDKVEKLTNLVTIFETSFNFSKNDASGDDIIGDAYEYLMRNFATESGKSKGQFYTPAEVSRIMAKILGISDVTTASKTVYDPACGSGSLLIKAADEAPNGLTIYGQEADSTTAGLAKMNLVLHNKSTGIIAVDSTFSHPKFKDERDSRLVKRFDFVVANPPFSYKAWRNGITPEEDPRFRIEDWGDLPPKKKGDYAWLIHCINSMNSTGKGAIILPHGVLFRGNAEETIRKNILEKRIIKGIIGLPANLFYGTGIPAAIIVLDKENTKTRKGLYIIDASKGFIKDGNKNRLREKDIKKIVDYFITFNESEPNYARFVTFKEIEDNKWNLNIPLYINDPSSDTHNITAHLKGGLPRKDIDDLDFYWNTFTGLKDTLFNEYKKGFYELKVDISDVASVIESNRPYQEIRKNYKNDFEQWSKNNSHLLNNIEKTTKPKQLIVELGNSIIKQFSTYDLIDKYDVYQALMAFWTEKMQDDAYLIVQDGYIAGNQVEKEMTRPKKGQPKMKSFEGKIIPKVVLINAYFKENQRKMDELERKLLNIQSELDELVENNNQDNGLFSQVWDADKESYTNTDLNNRIKELKKNHQKDDDEKEEYDFLLMFQGKVEESAKLSKELKEEEIALDNLLLDKYTKLSLDEVKDLIVNKTWLETLKERILNVYETSCNALTEKIKFLVNRYEMALPQIVNEISNIEQELSKMLEELVVTEVGDELDLEGILELKELLKNE